MAIESKIQICYQVSKEDVEKAYKKLEEWQTIVADDDKADMEFKHYCVGITQGFII